ncbi:YdcF family protein [Sphingomonas trueperi]|uniref:YdcF family protein n=1 Tax=Sphingomonas trueperi TaxID=53317 RepID=UPI000EB48D2A
MIRRLFFLLVLLALAWAAGFALFLFSLGKPLGAYRTDAVVVLTGGPGRIQRGLDALRREDAQRMLVSGVNPDVRPRELAAQFPADRALFRCCVDLGHEAVDTRSNADETGRWVHDHGYRSIRLVTSDWHMARARLELRHVLQGVTIVGDGVPSSPGWRMLMREYHKYLVRRGALLLGVD